jgi:DnaK suppressor protein
MWKPSSSLCWVCAKGSEMKELFSKKFWDGVKETFDEALEDPHDDAPQSAGKDDLLASTYTQIAMNIAHFKHLLQVKERELLAEVARLEAEARGAGEAEVRDPIDDATSAQGTSESLEEGSLVSETLIQVRDALKRIEDGTYGKCNTCGKQIPVARLEAVPWAPYCVEDQEILDRASHAQTGGSTL